MVYKLAALFSLDAFAGGFVVQSLLALWLFKSFGMSLAAASVFFFWTSLLSALSFPVAGWLARHFGLVNTMVFTPYPVEPVPHRRGLCARISPWFLRCSWCAPR